MSKASDYSESIFFAEYTASVSYFGRLYFRWLFLNLYTIIVLCSNWHNGYFWFAGIFSKSPRQNAIHHRKIWQKAWMNCIRNQRRVQYFHTIYRMNSPWHAVYPPQLTFFPIVQAVSIRQTLIRISRFACTHRNWISDPWIDNNSSRSCNNRNIPCKIETINQFQEMDPMIVWMIRAAWP